MDGTGRDEEDSGKKKCKKKTHRGESKEKKRAGENPRKLIMQHLLPTQPAHALPLSAYASSSSSSPSSSSFRILLHPSLLPSRPFSAASSGSSLLRAPPPPSPLPGGTEQPLFRMQGEAFGLFVTLRDGLKDKKKKNHTHPHAYADMNPTRWRVIIYLSSSPVKTPLTEVVRFIKAW